VCDFTLKLYWHNSYVLYPAAEKQELDLLTANLQKI